MTQLKNYRAAQETECFKEEKPLLLWVSPTLLLSFSFSRWNCIFLNENNSNQNIWKWGRQSHVKILKPSLTSHAASLIAPQSWPPRKLCPWLHRVRYSRVLLSNLYSSTPLLFYLATNRLFTGVIIQMTFQFTKHNKKIPFSFVPANLQTPSGSGLIHYMMCSCLPLSLANKSWLIPAEVNKN